MDKDHPRKRKLSILFLVVEFSDDNIVMGTIKKAYDIILPRAHNINPKSTDLYRYANNTFSFKSSRERQIN